MLKDEILGKVKDLVQRLSKTMLPRDKKLYEEGKELSRKFIKDSKSDFLNTSQERHEQSMKDSQGVSRFTGSGYHGAGNIDREKTDSNMRQRNFEDRRHEHD